MKVFELFEAAAQSDIERIIRSYCPKNFKAMMDGDAPALFRSTAQKPTIAEDGIEAIVVQGRTEPRSSATGVNYALDYSMQSPLWSGIPRRALSSSSTPSYTEAKEFASNCYLLIPFDSVKSFASSEKDFNMVDINGSEVLKHMAGFDNLFRSIISLRDNFTAIKKLANSPHYKELNAALHAKIFDTLPSEFARSDKHWTFKDLTELFKAGDAVIRVVKAIGDRGDEAAVRSFDRLHSFVDALLRNTLDEDESIQSWFSTNIDPDSMRIITFKSFTSIKYLDDESEVWFEGPWLGIKIEDARAFPRREHDDMMGKLRDIAAAL